MKTTQTNADKIDKQANILLDVIGKVEDAYILSAKKRMESVTGAVIVHWRKKLLLTAATIFLLLISSFAVAMVANAQFREAVFRFFHITTPVTVPDFEENVEQLGQIEVAGGTLVEDAINVEYIRVKGSFGHVASRGAVYVKDAEDGGMLAAYAMENGVLSRLEAHSENLQYLWNDFLYEISFEWYEHGDNVHVLAGDFDLDTGTEWSVDSIEGNSEYVKITISHGAQIEYGMYPLLYNLKTHEVVDVLGDCEEVKEQNIVEAEFSTDLSKLLINCGQNTMWYDEYSKTVYCYDLASHHLQALSELCEMNVMSAWFIDDDTVGCVWYDEEDNNTLRTLSLSSGEYFEIFSGLPELGWSSDGSGVSFFRARYGLLVLEDRSSYVYDFKTGERILIDGFEYSPEFPAVSFNDDGTKLLFFQTSLSEDVWITQIGVLDLVERSFISFEREGHGAPQEYSLGWFDNERIGIEAHSDEYWYLYLFTVNEPIQ